ncbi:MAG: ATP-binding protein [bacterium]
MKQRLLSMTRSIQSRFMISVGGLLVLLMCVVTVAVHDRLARLLLRETRARGVAIAHSIGATTTNALLNYDYVSLAQASVEAVQEGGIAYVVIFDKEGKVAAHAEGATFPDVRPAVRVDTFVATHGRPAPRLREETVSAGRRSIEVLDVAYPVYLEDGDVQWGTVRIGLDLTPMRNEIARVRLILLAIGLGGVLLALGGTRVIARRITRSIDDLAHGTIAVSRGNLDHRIDIHTGDEIAVLASHFNHMTAQVKRHRDEIAVAKRELEALNATLEEKVAKRTAEFLASEEKYRILVESSPDPILIVQEGVIVFVNPAFERLFGWSREETLRGALRMEELFDPLDRARALADLEAIVAGESREAAEYRGVAKQGEAKIFEMRGMRITYLDAPAVELILMDTTEKKALQETLIQHEKLRALGELASGVAHDFNNILGIILGRSQLLQRRVEDKEIVRGLKTIERAAQDGGETVRRIQDFARSRTERNFELIDVNALLQEVVEITRTRWRDQAEVRDVRIDVRLDLGAVAPVRGNGAELREVYTNLVFNSVDAMPAGGTITFTSRMDADVVVVEVRDTGQGMDDDVRARIFDPFFTTKGPKGMGLGMSVVYGIVERHNGKIDVDSAPDRGTCFTIRIPAAERAASAERPDSSVPDTRSARVLVVDDEPDILDLVSDILATAGHHVDTAISGPAALRLLEERRYDLMFCDLGMREMSGWEVVAAVRNVDRTIAIALLTGWGATLSEDRLSEYGIDAVLSKPFEMERILRTVQQVAERKAAKSVAG